MWNFATTKALLSYFSGQSDHTFSLLSHLSLYQDKLVEMIKYSFFSYQPILALIFFVSFIGIAIKYQKPRKEVIFLLIWVFSNAPLFIFRSGVLTVPVISTTIFGAVTLLFAVGIYQIYHTRFKYLSFILIMVFLISNIQLLVREQFRSVSLLSAIPLLLKDERSVIDYTYQSSAGKPFSICALTNPLFVKSTWSFLYTVYGKKYNFTPYWSGQPQHINKGMLPYDTQKVETRYLILEPLVGIPEEALKATVYMEDQVSEIVQEKKFGTLTVQKRKLNPAINGVRDSQNLSEEEARGVKGRIGNDPRYSCFMDYDL